MFGGLGIPELTVLVMIASMALIVLWPATRICHRLGFSPWLGLLAVVPVANLLLLWFVALADWPAHRARV